MKCNFFRSESAYFAENRKCPTRHITASEMILPTNSAIAL